MVGVTREVSKELRAGVKRRLSFALGRFGPAVERVRVRLSTVANPLGGIDQICHLQAWLRGEETVSVRGMDGAAGMDRAIARLAKRVEQALVDDR